MAETKLVHLKIDDRDVEVPAGTLVIEATRRLGIEVPSFCYYPGLTLQAACRMCLIEVEKAPKLQDMGFRYGADTSRFVEDKIHRPEEKWSDLVYYDAPRCSLWFRCVRVCDEGMDV